MRRRAELTFVFSPANYRTAASEISGAPHETSFTDYGDTNAAVKPIRETALDFAPLRPHSVGGRGTNRAGVNRAMDSQKAEQLFDSRPRQAASRASLDTRGTYDDRQDRILEAATEVIAREGYEKASMRAVAKASGVSLAGLYHYFDSKEKMLFLIQFRTFNALVGHLKEKLHGCEDPVEQLRILVRAHVSYFVANMAALKVCSHELDSLTGEAYEETRTVRREYYLLARSVVERLLARRNGSNGASDPRVATMSLFGTLNWLYRWYDPGHGPSPNAVANQIAGQFLQGVVGN